ncbi:MAG: hypothetical protein SNI70_11415 [Rikenellaceae bacterium]
MGKTYIGIVSIKVQFPRGYTPRSKTYKIGYITDKNTISYKEAIQKKYIDEIKGVLEKQIPKVMPKITSFVDVMIVDAIDV